MARPIASLVFADDYILVSLLLNWYVVQLSSEVTHLYLRDQDLHVHLPVLLSQLGHRGTWKHKLF